MAGINHAAVWLSAILYFIFGAAWYTAFSVQWLAGIGKTREQLEQAMGSSPTPYIIAFVAALAIAYTLARVLQKFDLRSPARGALGGALLGLGFIGAAIATNYGFEARPLSLWLINTGYVVIGMAVMGAIIGPWRKKKKVTVPLA
jgi:hypothetical protein